MSSVLQGADGVTRGGGGEREIGSKKHSLPGDVTYWLKISAGSYLFHETQLLLYFCLFLFLNQILTFFIFFK